MLHKASKQVEFFGCGGLSPRHRNEVNIKMDLKDTRYGNVDWRQDPVAGSHEHGFHNTRALST